jgi:hypothetical protein
MARPQVENEDLVFTLETMVEKFGDEIAPYAVSHWFRQLTLCRGTSALA